MHPLRFTPLFRRYLWGGRRLGDVLGKRIGPENDYAESWEVVDHGDDQSVAAAGPLAGKSLGEICRTFPEAVYGAGAAPASFPLLFKFLDAHRNLSVQVHPNDAAAAQLDPPDLGKTEAWIILHADPGSVVYAGLKRGFDRAALAREVSRGTTELCLHRFEPRAGDCLFIPAGVVHALGGGLLVAEIQQSSDTTFRLFDWNRVDADGKPRKLHIEEALAAIDYQRGPVMPQTPTPLETPIENRRGERLVACDKFILDRWRLAGETTLGGDGRPHILAVLEGAVDIAGDPAARALHLGETVLLPAACGPVQANSRAGATILDITLPPLGAAN